jgi:hypothetical protein
MARGAGACSTTCNALLLRPRRLAAFAVRIASIFTAADGIAIAASVLRAGII